MRNGKRERLESQGLLDPPRNRGNVLSRIDGKGIAQNQKIAACPARAHARRGEGVIFATFPCILIVCNRIVLPQDKCSSKMLTQSY